MPKLSVTVITRNEAANILAALDSVSWADELIVVDSHSTDDTVGARRRQRTSRVFVREWPGYSAQKNFAAEQASHDWILSLDADERVTPALADEIRALLGGEPGARGYDVPASASTWAAGFARPTGTPTISCGCTTAGRRTWAGDVHEGVRVSGAVGRLRAELQHFPYRDISHHLQTIDRYTTLAARRCRRGGRTVGVAGLAARPLGAFLRNYLARGGLRDGSVGPRRVDPEQLLRVPEVREALGAGGRKQ